MVAPEGVNVGLELDGIARQWYQLPSTEPLFTSHEFKLTANSLIILDYSHSMEGFYKAVGINSEGSNTIQYFNVVTANIGNFG